MLLGRCVACIKPLVHGVHVVSWLVNSVVRACVPELVGSVATDCMRWSAYLSRAEGREGGKGGLEM